MMRCVLSLLLAALFAVACSTSEPAESATPAPEASPDEQGSTGDDPPDDDTFVAAPSAPTAVPEPTLADDEAVTSITTMEPGTEVRDAQGNLIAIYGVAAWPETFEALADTAQADFPFFGDVADVADPESELVVLDVGMCAAGVNASGFGTAEFFLHGSAADQLSTDPLLGRGVLAHHPVVQPGFGFPAPAECIRGWLPVLWGSDQAPAVARYVLAIRTGASADVQRHVYQWNLDAPAADTDTDTETDTDNDADVVTNSFAPGETVTFNQGRLGDTTVVVSGWAELIGAPSPIDGTRLVAVSIDFCPAAQRLPEFGLGADGWNLIAPLDDDLFGATEAEDRSTSCFDGWLEFAVPFGAVPTSFFASDGGNAETGYAEWSLDTAALPAPQ